MILWDLGDEGLPDERVKSRHVHIGFDVSGTGKLVWDCATAWGDSDGAALESAIDLWLSSMGRGLMELLTQDGRFASRLPPGHERGLPGWHSVICPVSMRLSPTAEQRDSLWGAFARFAESKPWAALSSALSASDPNESYGLKLLIVKLGDAAEATLDIDGDTVELPADILDLGAFNDVTPPFILRQNAIALFRGADGLGDDSRAKG